MNRLAVVLLAAAVVGFVSGCKKTSADAPSPIAVTPRYDVVRVTVNGTGSAIAEAREIATKDVWAMLPDIVSRHGIRAFEGDALADDGFQARRILTATFDGDDATPAPAAELVLMAPGAVKGLESRRTDEKRKGVETFFQTHSYTSLFAHEEGNFTDLNGLFARIAESDHSFNLVVTDLADTKKGTLEPIPNPKGEAIRLIVVWTPEDPTLKGASEVAKRMTTWEQFEYRRTELRNAIPWAQVYPYNDLSRLRDEFADSLHPNR